MKFQRFRISVQPSPDTNDHEVLLFGDDQPLIPSDLMGMDPDDILDGSLRPTDRRHFVTYARCTCGVTGCGSADVQIVKHGDEVVWTFYGEVTHTFPAEAYEAEVERALRDTTWETPDRNAARLCREAVNRRKLAESGLKFAWASGRVQEGGFTVSLSSQPDSHQLLVTIPWGDESPEQIAKAMCTLLEQPRESWPVST